MDPRVADRLHDLGIASLCMTGYLYSEDVIEYLNRRKLTSPPLAIIEKSTDPSFVNQLFGEIKAYERSLGSRYVFMHVVEPRLHPQKISQQVVAVFGQKTFRMKLYTVDRVLFMLQPHHFE